MHRADLRASYDAVAGEYARRIAHELERKPFDRSILERFARSVRSGGTIADVGCGPGHVGRFLQRYGVRVCGLDLSAQMLEEARRLHPEIEFMLGDLRALPVPDGTWAGLVAFYSIIHIPPVQMVDTLRELGRVLERGAPLLLAFHVGDEPVHLEEWWDQAVSVDFYFFQPEQMQRWLVEAGFDITAVEERAPYTADIEHQSRRCYILARRPMGESAAAQRAPADSRA